MEPTKKELILAGAMMLIIPCLVEVVLRVSNVQFETQLYRADAQRGWAFREGANGLVVTETRQSVQINSRGFRDDERKYDKPQNTVRIAVLGNSWTEALQVPLDKTYCSVLERKLTEKRCFSGKRIEVLNFGVSGYSTAQELLLLREEVWKYHPDIVVVAFYSARDIANNVRQLNNAADPEQSPYFVYRGKNLVLDDSFRMLPAVQKRQITLQNIRGEVSDHILMLKGVNALVRYVRGRMAVSEVKVRAEKSGIVTLEHSVYKEPSSGALTDAWSVTEGLLLAMRDDVKAHGADFRIVTLANRPQVIPDPAKRAEFMNELGVADLSYADRRIQALGAREGILVTVLAPALSEYAEVHHMYLNGFDSANLGNGHWNETGHEIAGETIATSMCVSDTHTSSPNMVAAQ